MTFWPRLNVTGRPRSTWDATARRPALASLPVMASPTTLASRVRASGRVVRRFAGDGAATPEIAPEPVLNLDFFGITVAIVIIGLTHRPSQPRAGVRRMRVSDNGLPAHTK